MSQKGALSLDEAAEYIGISRSAMYDHALKGNLQTFKVGRRRLVRLEALDDWMRQQETATT